VPRCTISFVLLDRAELHTSTDHPEIFYLSITIKTLHPDLFVSASDVASFYHLFLFCRISFYL